MRKRKRKDWQNDFDTALPSAGVSQLIPFRRCAHLPPPETTGGTHPRKHLAASLKFYRAAVGRSTRAPSVDNFARNVA
jgi:hypothetical protein